MYSRKRFYREYEDGSGAIAVPRSTAYRRKRRAGAETSDTEQENQLASEAREDGALDPENVTLRIPPAVTAAEYQKALSELDKEDDNSSDDFIDVFMIETANADAKSESLTLEEQAFLLADLEKWRSYNGTKQRLAADLETTYLAMTRLAGPERVTSYPKSIYLLDKLYLGAAADGILLHYICKEHGCEVGVVKPGEKSNISFQCAGNGEDPHVVPLGHLHQSSMLTISMEHEIRQLLSAKGDEILAGLNARHDPEALHGDHYDFIRGKYYRILGENGQLGPFDITLKAHIDGAALSNSSTLKAYLVHWTIAELKTASEASSGRLHTAWVGETKDMPDRRVLLKPFLEEMKKLSTQGMDCVIGGVRRHIRVFVTCCIADVMERVPLVGISSIHSPHGCDKCLAENTLFHNPDNVRSHWKVYACENSVDVTSRTAENIRTAGKKLMEFEPEVRDEVRKNPKYKSVWELSVLASLKLFDLVASLPPDPMHLLLKGLPSKYFEQSALCSEDAIRKLDRKASPLNLPNVMSRKLRTFSQWTYFKPNEWRNFMFVLPFLLDEVIGGEELKIFMLLASVTTTAFLDTLTEADVASLRRECKELVLATEAVFGKGSMIYNVHQLLHIGGACENFGSMAGFCALTYEDWIGTIMRGVKGYYQVTREMVNSSLLHRITDHLTEVVSAGNVPADIAEHLRRLSSTKYHTHAVHVGDDVVLGKPITLRKLLKDEPELLEPIFAFAAEKLPHENLQEMEVKVYYSLITRRLRLSGRTSVADQDANALFCTSDQLLRFRCVLVFFKESCPVNPPLLLCHSGHILDEKPYNLPYHLPTFAVYKWTQNAVLLTSDLAKSVFVSVPYRDELHLACRLPKHIFLVD